MIYGKGRERQKEGDVVGPVEEREREGEQGGPFVEENGRERERKEMT